MRVLLAVILGLAILAGLYARRLYRWSKDESDAIELDRPW